MKVFNPSIYGDDVANFEGIEYSPPNPLPDASISFDADGVMRIMLSLHPWPPPPPRASVSPVNILLSRSKVASKPARNVKHEQGGVVFASLGTLGDTLQHVGVLLRRIGSRSEGPTDAVMKEERVIYERIGLQYCKSYEISSANLNWVCINMNFDKRQVDSGLGKFWEFTGNALVRLLMPPKPYPNLGVAFKSIYIGHDISKAKSYDRTRLGRLAKLPIEIIIYIFEATDLDGAAMLVAAHPQLFIIGYASILAKIKAISLFNNWAYDRIICIGDYARTLPRDFLSIAEKHRLMKWGIKHKAILDEFGDAPLDDIIEGEHGAINGGHDAHEAGLVKEVAAYEDQSFHLYLYGSPMPSLYDMACSRKCSPTLSYDLRERSNKLDGRRLGRLNYTLVGFNPYCDLDYPVLINITKSEFLKGVDEEGESIIGMAIPVLTVWGDDEGYTETIKREGEWAGDRLAIISEEELGKLVKKEEGWKERKVKWDDVKMIWRAY
ncbi:hypothetical protein EYR40_009963 [Pleurotus pulmonarius]|nr:hypothetical protein EYR40_009963 [Pleurotus pulmonarius]